MSAIGTVCEPYSSSFFTISSKSALPVSLKMVFVVFLQQPLGVLSRDERGILKFVKSNLRVVGI